MKNSIDSTSVNSGTRTCEIAEGFYISVNMEELPILNNYKSFCTKIKRISSFVGLGEEDKLKLFIISNLLTTSNLERFVKDNSEVNIPCESGSLTLRSIGRYDSLSIKDNGEESWRRDNRIISTPSQYVLNLRLEDTKRFNKDFIYRFLMNFRLDNVWTKNSKVADILSSNVSDITEKILPDKLKIYNEDSFNARVRYWGHIDWARYKEEIASEYGATIKISRSQKSDIWNVYISTLYSIFRHDIQKIIKSHNPIKKGIWSDENLESLLDEINKDYDIKVKAWQIKGVMKNPLSNQTLFKELVNIIESKKMIYPFLFKD